MPETPRLSPGDKAPDFTLADDAGGSVRLAELRGGKVIVYFYPAAMTPGCTTQACDFTAAMTEALEWATANEADVRQAIKDNLEVPEAVADNVPLPVFTAELDKGKIEELAELAVQVGVLPEALDFANLYR